MLVLNAGVMAVPRENLFWVSGKVGFRVSCLGSKGLRALGFRVEGFREVGPLGLRVRAVGPIIGKELHCCRWGLALLGAEFGE